MRIYMNEEKTPAGQSDSEKDSFETPHVFAVSKNSKSVKFTRRDFLQVASVAAASAALTGCTPPEILSPPTDTPSPTDTPVPTRTSTHTSTPSRTSTPTKTPTTTPTPVVMCEVKSSSNVRFGPSTAYQTIGTLSAGDKVLVLGRNPDSTWARIEKPGDFSGWLKATLLENSCDIKALQVVTPMPTPTALPGRAGRTAPGQKGVDYNFKNPITGITEQYTLPCGEPIPQGAICVCNCVTVPAGCSCNSDVVPKATKKPKNCSCDTVCTCNTVCTCDGAGHYWYPN